MFVDILKLQILSSLPQMYIYNLFIFSFIYPTPSNLHRKLVMLAIGHSIFTDGIIHWIPYHLHLINTLVVYSLLMFLLFRDIGIKRLLFVYIFANVYSIFMDLMLGIILIYILNVPSSDNLLESNFNELLLILYPQLILTLLAKWYIQNRSSIRIKQFFIKLIENNRSRLIRVVVLIILQFFLISMTLLMEFSNDPNRQTIAAILLYLTIAVSLCMLTLMLRLIVRARVEGIRSTQAHYTNDINHMFTSIKGQRHDFLNHVQVIHTMAQMGKYEQLRAYTSTLVQETREVSDIINHTVPALAAFAQAKTTVALGYGIAFTCELPERWNIPDTFINMLDLIKILGNLVDNAFDESNLLPAAERAVHVSIRRGAEGITLKVSNRGRSIDEETRARIFQAGFSTKGEGHSGLGLAIIQERVGHYGGTFDVVSDPTSRTTTFMVQLPCDGRHFAGQPAM